MKKTIILITLLATMITVTSALAGFVSYAEGIITSINKYNVYVIKIGDETFGYKNDGRFKVGEKVMVAFWNTPRTYECNCGDGGDLMELTDMTLYKY